MKVRIPISPSDRKCAEAVKEYFSGLGRRTLRSKLRGGEVWKIFWEDFEVLKQQHDNIGGQTYGEILMQFSKSGNKHHMHAIWNRMLKEDITPTMFLYSRKLECCTVSGDVIEANSIMKEMREVGLEPAPGNYFQIMRVFSKRGDYKNCRNVFELMVRKFKVIPSCRHLSVLIKSTGCFKTSQQIREEFTKYRISINEFGYSSLFYVIMIDTNATDVDAESAFQEALRDRRVNINQDFWEAYIASLVRYPDKMIAATDKMQEAGFTPDFRTYTHLLDTCIMHTTEVGDKYMRLGETIFEACVSRGVAETPIATQMIKLYSKFDQIDKIENVRRTFKQVFKTRETGVMLNTIRSAYAKAGRSEEEIKELMKESLEPFRQMSDYKFYGKEKTSQYLNTSLKKGRSVLRRTRDLSSGFDIHSRKPGGNYDRLECENMRRSCKLLATAKREELTARRLYDGSTYNGKYSQSVRKLIRDPSASNRIYDVTVKGHLERKSSEAIYWDLDECVLWGEKQMTRFLSGVVTGLGNKSDFVHCQDRVRSFVKFANREILPWAAGTSTMGPTATSKLIILYAMAGYDDPIIQILTKGEFLTVAEVIKEMEKDSNQNDVLEKIKKLTYATDFEDVDNDDVYVPDKELLKKIWEYKWNNEDQIKDKHTGEEAPFEFEGLNETSEKADYVNESDVPLPHRQFLAAAIEGYCYSKGSSVNSKVILWLMARRSVPLTPQVCVNLAIHYAAVCEFDRFDEMITHREYAITADATFLAIENALANFEISRAIRYLVLSKELGHPISYSVCKIASRSVESDEDALKIVDVAADLHFDHSTPRGVEFTPSDGVFVDNLLMRCVEKEFPMTLREAWRTLIWDNRTKKRIVHPDVCRAIIAFVVKSAALNNSSPELRLLATEVLHHLSASFAPVSFTMLLHLQMLVESEWYQQEDQISINLLKAVHTYAPNLDERLIYYLPGFREFRFSRKIVGGKAGLASLCSPYKRIIIPDASYCLVQNSLLQDCARGGSTAVLLPFSVLSNLQVMGDEMREVSYLRKSQQENESKPAPEVSSASDLVKESINPADSVLSSFGMYASSFVGRHEIEKRVSPNLLILGFIEQHITSVVSSPEMDPFSYIDRVIATAAAVLSCDDKLNVTIKVVNTKDATRVEECLRNIEGASGRYEITCSRENKPPGVDDAKEERNSNEKVEENETPEVQEQV